MTRRWLPRDEWAKLDGTELERIVPLLPDDARVLVVEDGETIMGCCAFVYVLHAEGLWIHEAARGKASVLRQLIRGLSEVQRQGAPTIGMSAVTATMERLIRGLGAVRLPGVHYVMRRSWVGQ